MASLSSENLKLTWTRTPGELIPVTHDSSDKNEHLSTNHVLEQNHRETRTGT